jgi:hypothetical protein
MLDHRFGAAEAEALQGAIDEKADTLTGNLFAICDVVLEARVTELRHRLVDEIFFPAPEQLTQFHPHPPFERLNGTAFERFDD